MERRLSRDERRRIPFEQKLRAVERHYESIP
jgi:hypothetical protein